MPNSTQKKGKFLSEDPLEHQKLLKESIRKTPMSKLLENSPDLYKFVYEYAKQIGTKGQNKVRIVFTKLGKIITFFPE